jgi:hypothetical protein
MKIHYLFPLLILYLSPRTHASFLDSGLEIGLAGDLVYSQGLSSQSGADEKLRLRGAELMLYGPIDHVWEGRLSLAAHDEAGQTNFQVHELYVENNNLIPRTTLKIGQYFLGIGRLNRFHQHDWPFTTAPKVHRDFLASEGVFDAGVETQTLLPTSQYLKLTLGLTSGYRFGHVHSSGTKPKTPTHYLRLNTFFPMRAASGVEWGASYLGRTNSQNEKTMLIGMDLTAKWRQGKILRWMLMSEAWYRDISFLNSSDQREVGAYGLVHHGWSQNLSLGLRLDGFKNLTQKNILGRDLNNITYGSTFLATHKSSEFFTARLSASHEFTRTEGVMSGKDTRVELQFVFIMGAHPAHEF